ncbi:hypothetical protein ACH4D4_06415 [Streptomyces pristinaespiralis]|uniref:hypothetical protein n=1 Tax=Streptomyces pristinaespiralis TaxID=38300 RepID=UPI0037ACC88B
MEDPDPGYTARRRFEVRQAMEALTSELDDWRKIAQSAPMATHRSQIESAARVVATALEHVSAMLPADQDTKGAEIVLDLHHVWDFFRGKLMLRHHDPYRAWLTVTDELAWALYRPVRDAATGTAGSVFKEPPLTFLNRQPVPFASARGSDFEDLLAPGRQRTGAGRRASRHLPFPVIGIPWSASRHIPSLLAVAHETGHHIEDDFGLTATLVTRLREDTGLAQGRIAVWEPWLGEAFADMCAALACGTAYVWTLTDALTSAGADPHAGAGEYPSPRMRALVCRACLTADEPGPLPALPGRPQPTDSEAEAVVAALLGNGLTELGGRTLASLIGLRRPGGLADSRERLRSRLSSGRRDVPGVFAAATLAFVHDPDAYQKAAVGERAMRDVLALVPKGPRGGAGAGDLAVRRDAALGRELAGLLTTEAAAGPRSTQRADVQEPG